MPSSSRSLDDVRAVYRLKAEGLPDCEVSRRTGIPVNTIRAWRNRRMPDYARPSIPARAAGRHSLDSFDLSTVPPGPYAYLLGA